jgi:hypothetical protein
VPEVEGDRVSAGQDEAWPSGLWKGEWDSTLSNALLMQVRSGLFFERGRFIANDHANLQYLDTGANTLLSHIAPILAHDDARPALVRVDVDDTRRKRIDARATR